MANAKRPGIPAEATKVGPNTNDGEQPKNNMAPFTPAPANSGEDVKEKGTPAGKLLEEGTGRC